MARGASSIIRHNTSHHEQHRHKIGAGRYPPVRQYKDPCLLIIVIEQLLHFRTVVHFLIGYLFFSGFRHRVIKVTAKGPPGNTSISVHCTAICNQYPWVHHVTAKGSSPQILKGSSPQSSVTLPPGALSPSAPLRAGVRSYGDRSHVVIANSMCR